MLVRKCSLENLDGERDFLPVKKTDA